MKYIILIFTLANLGFINAQIIPVFTSDSTSEDRNASFVFCKIKPSYDQVISYTGECYWPTKQSFYVLANKNDKWRFYRWRVKYKDEDKNIENILVTHKTRIRINNCQVETLFRFWTASKFWGLTNDSLTYAGLDIQGNKRLYLGTTDGCIDRFEIITDSKYKKIQVYNVDAFQKENPGAQREQFIHGRNEFYRLITPNKKLSITSATGNGG